MDRGTSFPPNGSGSGIARGRDSLVSNSHLGHSSAGRETGRRSSGFYSTPAPRGSHGAQRGYQRTPTTSGHYLPRQELFDTSGLSSPPRYDGDADSDSNEENGGPNLGRRLTAGQLPLTGSSRFNCHRGISTPTSQALCGDSDVVALLQEQQVLIQQVLSQQACIQQKQHEFDQKLAVIEGQLSNATEPSTTSSSSSEKRKSRVPRELSVSWYY